MARTLLDKELQELDEQIIQLGRLVDDALGKALEALETGDLAKSGLVIEADAIIDSLRAAVEEHTIRLLTLQQPLGGRDLRFLTSALSIAGDLERTGDGAAGIAQIILRMTPLRSNGDSTSSIKFPDASAGEAKDSIEITEASILRGILDLGHEARKVLQGTMGAFANRDVKGAIPALQSDALILQRATYLLWIAHKLERVADHSGNICERIVFIVEGETSIKRAQE